MVQAGDQAQKAFNVIMQKGMEKEIKQQEITKKIENQEVLRKRVGDVRETMRQKLIACRKN